MSRRVNLSTCLTAVAFAIAGCGGDDGGSGSASSVTRAEFVRQADAICEREKSGLEREASLLLRRQTRPKPRPELISLVARYVLLPAIERENAEIAALAIPRRDEARIDQILNSQEQALNRVAVRATLPSFAAVYKPFAGPARRFRAYGLSSCANGPRPPVDVGGLPLP